MRTLVAPRALASRAVVAWPRALSAKSAASKRSPASHADKQHSESLLKRKPLPPPGWDSTLVDRMLHATAADLIARPCVTTSKPITTVLYVKESSTIKECAQILWRNRVGVLMAMEDDGKSVAGIISERDFVKALATDSIGSALVKDLMTPKDKLVTVDLDTGVGKCMELMRVHQIRHLPVMGRSKGEEGRKALEAIAEAAAASAETKRRYFNTYKAKLQDALGSEGAALFTALSETPRSYTSDGRPLVARAAAACEKLRYAEDKHGAATQALENGQIDSDYPVGIVSVRDLLLSVTAQQMVPLLEWLDDERRSLIEERVGYSE